MKSVIYLFARITLLLFLFFLFFQIKTYPRVIESSLRRKEEKRKLKREALKKRKEGELEQKRIEIKQLKKRKKQELLEKIKNLKEITGNERLGFDVSYPEQAEASYFVLVFITVTFARMKIWKRISTRMSTIRKWASCLTKNFTS